MIDKYLGAEFEAKFLDSVGIGPSYRFQLAELVDADLRRIAELVRRYVDRRLGGTGTSVIAICERLSIATAATVNRRDFANVQPRHVSALVPPGNSIASLACRFS